MSFLAPLYLLATLAVGLPIAFHLIRRSPQGRQIFGSVMFLTPDPPKTTKRSHVEDWLLLLLRAAAICLLAFAFARPFLRSESSLAAPQSEGRRIAILLDRSASMQRENCWSQAQQAVQKVLADLTPADDFMLMTFDAEPHNVVTFEEWGQLPIESRRAVVEDRVRQLTPGWLPTQAGKALITAVEQLNEVDKEDRKKHLILVSDMQVGGGWETLNTFTWPENSPLQVVTVGPTDISNAALHLANDDTRSPDSVRIRVTNAPGSTSEAFQIGWRDPFSTEEGIDPKTQPVSTLVPPGQSRILRIPTLKENTSPASALVLTGDAAPFDNTCQVLTQERQQIRIMYLGPQGEKSGPNDLRFFLPAIFPPTSSRQVEVVNWIEGKQSPEIEQKPISWLLIGGEVTADQAQWIHGWLEKGGTALFVARHPDQATAVYDLLGIPPAPVSEAKVDNYAMLQQIDFSHPAMKQFDDPRYSDFTKLRFWKYREFDPATLPSARVLAGFESGAPALAEMPVGQGKMLLLASGWNRDDSDLAVSSKFVPLMNALLDDIAPTETFRHQQLVGEQVLLKDLGLKSETIAIRRGDETSSLLATARFEFEKPGLYRFADSVDELAGEKAVLIAVNLPAEESRTELFSPELLAAVGVRLDTKAVDEKVAAAQSPSQQRQLMNHELESRQHWWRWLVVATLLILFVETLLANFKARPRTVPSGTEPALKPSTP